MKQNVREPYIGAVTPLTGSWQHLSVPYPTKLSDLKRLQIFMNLLVAPGNAPSLIQGKSGSI